MTRLRHSYPWLVGLVLSVAIALPFASGQNSWYEWANPYWLLLLQREEVASTGLPSYFIHTPATGLYYPINLFYGGLTISILAFASVAIPTWFVFSASIVLSALAAFVGVLWIASACRVSLPVATASAALYTANPQYLAKMYTRGAWAEFVAVSMLTLAIGCGMRLVDRDAETRSGALPAALLATSVFFLAGTHNLTLAIGSPIGAVLLTSFAWTRGGSARATLGLLRPVVLAASVGLAMSAAFTLPNIWLSGSTAITQWDYLDAVPEWNTPEAVFGLHLTGSTSRVNEVPSLVLIPILLLVFAALGRVGTNRLRPAAVALVAGSIALVLAVLTTQGALWSDTSSILHRVTPASVLRMIQFPSRLSAYLALTLLIVLLALLGASRAGTLLRLAKTMTVVAAAWYVAVGLFFVFTVDSTTAPGVAPIDRHSVTSRGLPVSFAHGQQTQFLLTAGGRSLPRPEIAIAFDADGRSRVTDEMVDVPLATNVVWSPLVRFEGAELLGRDETGRAVIVATDDAPVEIEVQSARPAPVLIGQAISLVGAAVALGWIVRRSRQWGENTSTSG